MTILDWVLVVIWAGITLGGFFKGAVRIVFGLGGIGLGIWLAVVVGDDLAIALLDIVDQRWLALGMAYVLPVLLISGLCLLAGWGMEKTLEALKLGCLNRLLGAVLAGIVAAAVLAILLVSAVRISPEVAAIEKRSVLLSKVQMMMGLVVSAHDDEAPTATDVEEPAADDSSAR